MLCRTRLVVLSGVVVDGYIDLVCESLELARLQPSSVLVPALCSINCTKLCPSALPLATACGHVAAAAAEVVAAVAAEVANQATHGLTSEAA